MPFNGFTLGRDATFNIVDPNANIVLASSQIMDFQAAPLAQDQMVKTLAGDTPIVIHSGWGGQFSIQRQDSSFDDYWNIMEANYYNGVNTLAATITETINEPDGSVSEYIFTGVAVLFSDPGTYAADRTVTMKLSFKASRRQKVS